MVSSSKDSFATHDIEVASYSDEFENFDASSHEDNPGSTAAYTKDIEQIEDIEQEA